MNPQNPIEEICELFKNGHPLYDEAKLRTKLHALVEGERMKQMEDDMARFRDSVWLKNKIADTRKEVIDEIAGEIEKDITEMADPWTTELFREPWEGWQTDIDELAKSKGYRIDNVSANLMRRARKITKENILESIITTLRMREEKT